MIIKRFIQQVENYPEKCAIKTNEQELTYKELHHKSDCIALQMAALISKQNEQPVLLLFQHGIAMITAALSTLKTGNLYVPLSPATPPKRLADILKDSEALLILTDTQNSDTASHLATQAGHQVSVLNLETATYATTTPPPGTDYEQNSPAYLLYTSGSTGKPKGVLQSHENILHFIDNYCQRLAIDENHRLTLFSAFNHDAAVMDIYSALLTGATLYPLDIKETEITTIAQWLKDNEITIWHSVPTVYRYFVNCLSGAETFPHLRSLVMGGEAVLTEDVFRFKRLFPTAEFVNLYGQSESSYNSSQHITAASEFQQVLLGEPIDEVTLLVVDDEGEETAPFREGEIIVVNNHCALGYWKDPEKTEEVFTKDDELGRLYWTGDRGRRLLDGNIEFTGRIDFQVKIRGYRVELGEIETILLKHETISETVVVPLDEPDGQKTLCAYVVPADGKKIKLHEIREFLSLELMDHMIPAYFVELEKLPVTATGKIDRKTLPEIEGRMMTGAEYAAPSDDVEENLTGVWQEVLNLPKIGVDDNFFQVGGHSMKATVLTARLHKSMSIEFPLKELFRSPTIRAMARFIRDAETSKYKEIPAAEPRDFYPLSPAQQRLYLLEGIQGSGTGYNISYAVQITGKPDKTRLNNAFQQLVQRHESLRTAFLMKVDQPVQVVHEELDFEPQWVKEGDKERQMTEFIRPFDLSQAPLLRVMMIESGETENQLLMDMHHIISDGTSMGIITTDLAKLYGDSQLPELRLQYKDFAVWQKGALGSGILEQQEHYWKNRFDGEIPVLDLPTDWERPEVQSFEGANLRFYADNQLTQRLDEIAAGCNASLYMVLLAGYNVMLTAYSRSEDIIVGTPTSGRSHMDLENMVGMFVNTLALRNRPQGELTFTAFLEDIKKQTLEAFENQDFQLEELLELLEIRRDLSRNPLFDTAFTLQNFETEEIQVEELVFKPLELETTIAKFDMTLTAFETGDGLGFDIQYSTGLFKKETIQAMTGHFMNILEQVTTDPLVPLKTVDMLTEEEKHRLLVTFNDRDADYPREKTLQQLFSEQAVRTPGNFAISGPCIAGGQDSLFYYELNEKTEHLGLLLREKGVGPEVIVGILTARTVEMVIAILSVLKAGGTYMPLDPDYPKERIAFMLKDSGAKILLSSREIYGNGELLGDWQGEYAFIEECDQLVSVTYATGGRSLPSPAQPHNAAYIIYTSGTTGRPKGVVVEQRNVVSLMVNSTFPFDFNEGDVWTIFHSICFDFSVWEMYGALLYGGKAVIIPPMIARDTAAFLETLAEEGVTVLNHTPSAFYPLMREALKRKKNTPSIPLKLRYVIFGAETLKHRQLKQWVESYPETRLVNLYGITETTVIVTHKKITAKEIERESASVGITLSTLKTYVTDPYQRLLPPGIPGELCVGGEGVARGYLNRPELTAEKFVTPGTPHFTGDKRMYLSGDLVTMQANGEINFLGRIDQQVKIRGFRIELGEIENRLLLHSEVKSVVILARILENDPQKEPVICAYVVPENPVVKQQHLVPRLREHLAETLPSYMLPAYFIKLEAIPLTANGKVNRKALPEPGQITGGTAQAPRNPMEEQLLKAFAGVLGQNIAGLGIDNNFFESGGHSLKAAVLVQRVMKDLQVKLTLRELFSAPTVRQLATYLEETEKIRYAAIQPAEERTYYPLTPAQNRLYTLRQLETGGPGTAYNITTITTMEGTLYRKKLTQAFQQLVDRHESLRTRFETIEGQPAARLLEQAEFTIEDYQAEAGQETLAIDKFIRPFHLDTAPLMRVGIIKNHTERYLLMMDMHHIITDGVSMGIVLRELIDAYEGRELPALRLRYRDYAMWLEQWGRSGAMEQQEAYWLKEFAEEPPTLELPTDYPRPAIQQYEGRSIDFSIDPTHTRALEQIAAAEGGTLFMVLLALYNILLSRYGGTEDIVVGTPIAGRNHADLEYIIGMFVGTLPLRNRPEGNKTFATVNPFDTKKTQKPPAFAMDINHAEEGKKSFLANLEAKTLQAFENQEYPFEELVDKLELRRDLSRSPLFDTMLSFQAFEMPPLEVEELRFSQKEFDNPTSKFDLTLTAAPTGDGLDITIQYADALFKKDTLQRMAGHLVNLVHQVTTHPTIRLKEMEILSVEETHRLLVEFNETHNDYPEEKTILQLFDEQAKRRPGNIAVLGDGLTAEGQQFVTYSQLRKQSEALARDMQTAGMGPGKVGAVMSGQNVEMVAGILAILKTGAAYVPIDPAYPAERITYILRDSRATVFLTSRPLAEKLTVKAKQFYLETLSHYPSSAETSPPETAPAGTRPTGTRPAALPKVQSWAPAYIIYTSGSTGKPKGVVVRHRALVNMCVWYSSDYSLTAEDRISKYAGFGFDVSVWEIFAGIINGASLCIVPGSIRTDMEQLNSYFENNGITIAFLPAQMTEQFTASVDNRSLRILVSAGDKLRETVPRRYRLINLYGPTEYTVFATGYTVEGAQADIPIGKPIFNTSLYILDKEKRLQPVGVPGELYISGDGLAEGYLNRPGLTAEAFQPNPFEPGKKMYKTGDLVSRLPDGNLRFMGRLDFQVKIRGFRIELGEIENALLSCDAVTDAIVVALEEETGNRYLCAYIVLATEGTEDTERKDGTADAVIPAIRVHLSRSLPEYMLPAYFEPMKKLPLNSAGKVDRRKLPQPTTPDRTLTGVRFQEPRDAEEKQLADIFLEILKLEKVGIDDSFFHLGGHSLKATILVSNIHKYFDISLPLAEIFKTPTIRGLAQTLKERARQQETGAFSAIPKAPEREYYPLSSTQRRMYLAQITATQNTSYNLPYVTDLEGPLDRAYLEEIMEQLLHRHESFRTTFLTVGGVPVQQIQPQVKFNIDYHEPAASEMQQQIHHILQEFVRPFKMDAPPLLRAGLVRREAERHILMLDMHHIISDGTSLNVLLEEFMALYEGKKPPPLTLQYKDFVYWLESENRQAEIKKQAMYWLEQYRKTPPQLQLPLDYPRPGIKSFDGLHYHFFIDKETVLKIKETAQSRNATLFMILLALYNVLLAKLTGQEDIVVGTSVAGRRHADLQPIVGMFVNALALRHHPGSDKTFGEFLAEVKENTLAAFENQDYSFEELVDFAAGPRDPGRNPIFDTMFVLNNEEDVEEFHIPGLTLKPCEEYRHTSAQMDLKFRVRENDDGLTLSYEYSVDLFKPETIEMFAENFHQVVNAVITNPAIPLKDITLTHGLVEVEDDISDIAFSF
ncbi:MAG: amino acid adenylation domain-containing protein [bacterium]|nr:amino acid adenylation domain-containing protein [bacterium]